MRVEPTSLATFARTRGGKKLLVDDDVNGVARDLAAISDRLELHFNERGEFFVVVQRLDDGTEHMVFTAQECDQRIVNRVREITAPGYDFAAEVERLDVAAEARREHEFNEKMGEAHERLAHAIRKDTGQRLPDYVRKAQGG